MYNRKPFASVHDMNWKYVNTNKNTGVDFFWKSQVCLTVFYLFLAGVLKNYLSWVECQPFIADALSLEEKKEVGALYMNMH